jgi:acyl carrier protein
MRSPAPGGLAGTRRGQMSVAQEIERFILAELSGPDRQTVGPDEDLIERGLIDSLGIILLTTFMEEKFGITIGSEEIVPANFRNIGSLARFVEGKQSAP